MKEKRNFIWTSEMAYIVGLITTDGCLSNDGRHISFTSKNIDLIRTFCDILNLKNKIGKNINSHSETHRVQFGDVQFYKWLLTIGLTPKKSKTLGSIVVPNEYFIDFLRGHLDGDGSITTYTDRHNTYKNPEYVYQRLTMRFISASKKHVAWIHKKVSTILGIKGRLHTTKPKAATGNRMYVLKFYKKDSLNLLRKIYYSPNLPSLKRKQKVAHLILESNKNL